MGRLKRSCVVGSVVFHTLTLALLFLAPIILAKREEKVEVIDLIPSEIVDQIMAPPAPVAPPTPPALVAAVFQTAQQILTAIVV